MPDKDIYNVLIVDDEEPILRLMERQLQPLPFIIIPTSSSAEALHILRTKEIALLLCDLNMPNIDGHAVLRAAREENPQIVSIVITGGNDPNATIRAINEGGIWKYIQKPWQPEELERLVTEGVQHYATLKRQQKQLNHLARAAYRKATGKAAKPKIKVMKKPVLPPETQTPDPVSVGLARPEPGFVLGNRYEIERPLGEGGAGIVFKAQDTLLNMPVAVKMLRPEITADQDALNTLKEEARIAMQLSHRHIVRLHTIQYHDPTYFLVMEYVSGRTLYQILQEHGPLDLDTVRQIAQVCADALTYAHRHNVIHRDLKPANLLLEKSGVLKIIDFGVACLAGTQNRMEAVTGTPIYMSPEQIMGRHLDARTDVYSTGVILYQLLTGNTPFPANTTDLELLVEGPHELPGLTPPVELVLRKAMAQHRADRFPTVSELASALMEC